MENRSMIRVLQQCMEYSSKACRVKDLIQRIILSKTVDRLITGVVVLRREDGHVLRRALQFGGFIEGSRHVDR